MKAQEVIGHERVQKAACSSIFESQVPPKVGPLEFTTAMRVARDDGPFSYYR